MQNDVEKVLLFGGYDEQITLKSIFEYSLETESCVMLGVMLSALEGHTVTKINACLLLICGGYDGVSVINNLYLYNTVRKSMILLDTKLNIVGLILVAFFVGVN